MGKDLIQQGAMSGVEHTKRAMNVLRRQEKGGEGMVDEVSG